MFDAFLEIVFAFIFAFIFELILELCLMPIYDYVLFPIFEPVCWLTGSVALLVLTLGLIRPSRKKRLNRTSIWGYFQGKQYYLDRGLVSAIGLILWFVFISLFVTKLLLFDN